MENNTSQKEFCLVKGLDHDYEYITSHNGFIYFQCIRCDSYIEEHEDFAM